MSPPFVCLSFRGPDTAAAAAAAGRRSPRSVEGGAPRKRHLFPPLPPSRPTSEIPSVAESRRRVVEEELSSSSPSVAPSPFSSSSFSGGGADDLSLQLSFSVERAPPSATESVTKRTTTVLKQKKVLFLSSELAHFLFFEVYSKLCN